jgi:hypothetical protein
MRKVINNGRNRSVMDLILRRPNKGEMICTAFHSFFLPPSHHLHNPHFRISLLKSVPTVF